MANTMSNTPLESVEMGSPAVPDTGGTQVSAGNAMAPGAGEPGKPPSYRVSCFLSPKEVRRESRTAPQHLVADIFLAVTVNKGFDFDEGRIENALKRLEQSELASSEQLPDQGMSPATDASNLSPFPPQGPATGSQPKKRGRPRKQLTGAEPKGLDGGQSSIATPPPRKRGRPPKPATKDKPATGDTPTSEDKRLMASIRRSSRANTNIESGTVSKNLFNNVQSTQQGHLQGPMTTTGAPEFMIGKLSFGMVDHAFNNFDIGRNEVGAYNPNSTAGHEATEYQAVQQNTAVQGAHQCSCDAVKGIMQDVLFRHSLQEQDVWVVPRATAVEMHRYFGGGTPVPQTDVLIPAEKVEMIRNLLF